MKIFTIILLLCYQAFAEKPKIYTSIPAMIEELGDYSESNGTFKIVAKDPIHIQLSPLCAIGHEEGILDEYSKLALVYGVYKTFIHTKANKVTITSIPLLFDRDKNTNNYLTEFSKKITITREEALTAIKNFKKLNTFNELVKIQDLGGFKLTTWSENFHPYIYNDKGFPGLDKFYKELAITNKN